MKKHKIILVLMGLALLLWGCSSSTLVEVVEGPDTLAEGGHYKLGGAGIKPNFLRSFDFSEGELIAEDLFDEELLQYVPVLPANEWLPFEFPKRLAYSTSYSKPGDDKLYNQLQLTYLPEKNATGDFFCHSYQRGATKPDGEQAAATWRLQRRLWQSGRGISGRSSITDCAS